MSTTKPYSLNISRLNAVSQRIKMVLGPELDKGADEVLAGLGQAAGDLIFASFSKDQCDRGLAFENFVGVLATRLRYLDQLAESQN